MRKHLISACLLLLAEKEKSRLRERLKKQRKKRSVQTLQRGWRRIPKGGAGGKCPPNPPLGPAERAACWQNAEILSKYIRIVIVAFGPRGTRIVAANGCSLRFPTLRLPASPTGRGRLRSRSDSCLYLALRAWVTLGISSPNP